MKKHNEIKAEVEKLGEMNISKPESITTEEWQYYNEIEILENALQVAKNEVFDAEKRIETRKALNGEF